MDNMKKIANYLITLGLLLFMATSCTDVLDKQSVSSFNESVVFADINVVKSYLGKCYDRLGGNTNNGILGMREDLLSSATDQTLCIHRPNNYANLKGTLSPDYLGYFSNTGYAGHIYWDNLYANIQNINTILASIDAVVVTNAQQEALKTQLKGEAYFLRAFEYAHLLMNYGGAVIQNAPFLLADKDKFKTLTRSTIAQTKDQVLADIDQAIALIPASMEQGRANKAAAQALKARVLMFCASPLTNGGYEPSNTLVSFPSGSQTALLQAARDAAKAIMDGTYGTFTLTGTTADPPASLTETQIKSYADNFFNIFNQKGKWNTETIWGIQYPLTGGNVNRANIWFGPNGYHNWGNNNPTEPALRQFEMSNGTPFVWDKGLGENLRQATAAQLAADPLLNPYAGREPRFYATILYHGAPWQARPSDAAKFDPENKVQSGHFYKGSLAAPGAVAANGIDTRQGLIESWNGTKNGYYLKKFMDPATVGQYYYNTNTWVEFRYSEVLLIYAEACIELGGADLVNGINALNMVRNRAGLPDRSTSATQAEARTYLRQERFVEFFAEGHHWYDIRRWMTATTGIIKDVYEMKVRQYENGDWEWKIDPAARADARSWTDPKFYWLPITRTEMNKSESLQQNPGYN
jgi:hypothetical protein